MSKPMRMSQRSTASSATAGAMPRQVVRALLPETPPTIAVFDDVPRPFVHVSVT
jgi:hypothetical protein